MFTCLSLMVIPVQLIASSPSAPPSVLAPAPKVPAEVKVLESRLNEIKALDRSKMKSAERKSLRKEVKNINYKLHQISGGVYISAGAIIIILLLLLIL